MEPMQIETNTIEKAHAVPGVSRTASDYWNFGTSAYLQYELRYVLYPAQPHGDGEEGENAYSR